MSEMRRCTKCLYWHAGETCSAPPAGPEYAVSVLALDLERAEKFAADLRAQLAQCDAELEALRRKVREIHAPQTRFEGTAHEKRYCAECTWEVWPCPTVAALSDNQEPDTPDLFETMGLPSVTFPSVKHDGQEGR